MTDRAALLQLRDRLAQATGPDRELDAEIARASGWTNVELVPVWTSDEWCGDEPGYDPNDDGEEGPSSGMTVPRYTASTDAALTLTPSGWLFQITQAKGDQKFTARFTNPANGAECANFGWHVREDGQRMDMDAYLAALRWERTPALALCLARVELELAKTSQKGTDR